MAIEFTASMAGYSVVTRSDQTHFTVYHGEGEACRIAGTIMRPMRGDRHWSAWGRDGFLGNTIGPRTALALFVKQDRRDSLS